MTSIRINLLPHRQMRRARMQRMFAIMAIASAVAGVAVVALGQAWISNQQSVQQARNAFLRDEIAKLDKQIAEIKQLKEKTQDLLARKEVVESLQANRGESVRLFDALAREVPEGLYLRAVKQTGDEFSISGFAQSSARVSTFMRALDASDFFLAPLLVEVKAAQVGAARMNEFSLKVQVERRKDTEDEPKKPAAPGGQG
ncbi:MAG: PilN domain-containing protein [Pseudomonadota bacterium]